MSGLSVVILQLVVNYGFDEEVAGKLIAFKSLFVLFPCFGSSYVRQLGYKKSMLCGLLGVTTASMIIALVRDFWAVLFLFAISGFSHTLIKISVYSIIGLITTTSQKHTSLMNKVEGAYIIGALFGPLLFSWMIQWHFWHDTYWTIAMLTVLVGVLLLMTKLDESAADKELEQPRFSQIFSLLNYSWVKVLAICICLSVMLELGFKTWLPTFNTEVFKLSEAQSVLFLSIHAGAIALGRFLSGYLQEHNDWIFIQLLNLTASFILTLIVLILTAFPFESIHNNRDFITLAFIFSTLGLFLGSSYPTICSKMLSHFPKKHHSAMSGLIVIFAELGVASGVSIIGFLSKHFSIHNAFYFMLIPMIILQFLLILYNKFFEEEIMS